MISCFPVPMMTSGEEFSNFGRNEMREIFIDVQRTVLNSHDAYSYTSPLTNGLMRRTPGTGPRVLALKE